MAEQSATPPSVAAHERKLEVVQYRDAKKFWNDSRAVLELHTAENNLIIGLVDRELSSPGSFDDFILFAVNEDGSPVLGAMQTREKGIPNHFPMIFSWDSSAGLEPTKLLAQYLLSDPTYSDRLAQRGVQCSERQAELFAAELEKAGKGKISRNRALWVYSLTQLNEDRLRAVRQKCAMGGTMRFPNTDNTKEIQQLRKWVADFLAEIHEDPSVAGAWFDRMIQNKKLWVWELSNGEVVALAGSTRQLPSAASVGPVFTPAEHRGKGYASLVVGELSRHILHTKGMAILFADDTNPISNHVYQSLGYQKICLQVTYKPDQHENKEK